MVDISIFTPVYNCGEYIKRCIDSVLSQEFNGTWEWIIVDDGSIDNTVELIKEYNDERIKLIECEHRGIVDASNEALNHCNGKYCARIDGDDVMLPNRLQAQYDFMESHEEYGFTCGMSNIITNTKFSFERTRGIHGGGEISMKMLLMTYPITHSTIMFKNELNLRYAKEWEWAEDTALYLDYVYNGGKIYCLGDFLAEWHVHNGQICNRLKKESDVARFKLKMHYARLEGAKNKTL